VQLVLTVQITAVHPSCEDDGNGNCEQEKPLSLLDFRKQKSGKKFQENTRPASVWFGSRFRAFVMRRAKRRSEH
jgi:hypothetical protein